MRRGLFAFLLALALPVQAQEGGPEGVGPWAVVLTQVSIVEVSKNSLIVVHNTGNETVLLITFATIDECQTARNVALNPSGFDVSLGTGSGLTAHIGRSVSECFQR